MVLQRKSSTEEQVIDLIGWTLGMPSSNIFPYLHLRDDLYLDAIDIQLLIIKLESHFRVILTPEEVDSIETVWDAISSVKQHGTLV